jgi:hypothetical protein
MQLSEMSAVFLGGHLTVWSDKIPTSNYKHRRIISSNQHENFAASRQRLRCIHSHFISHYVTKILAAVHTPTEIWREETICQNLFKKSVQKLLRP